MLLQYLLNIFSFSYNQPRRLVHWHFEHTWLVDMLLIGAIDSVVHWVDVGAAWSGDMNMMLPPPANDSVAGSVWDSAVLLKDLWARMQDDILSKFCGNVIVNNWLNMCETLT